MHSTLSLTFYLFFPFNIASQVLIVWERYDMLLYQMSLKTFRLKIACDRGTQIIKVVSGIKIILSS